jgi:hypothetical protein
MEGSVIRGPFALCEEKDNGAKVLEDLIPELGEVNNSVISAYSNKGHDFFRKLSFGVTLVQTVIIRTQRTTMRENCGVMKQKVC